MILALLGTAATQAANLATAMIAARALLPEGRGDLALIVLWPMLAAQVASVSLSEALLVLTASGRGDSRRLFATGLWLTLALAAVAAAVAGLWLAPATLAARPEEVQAAGRLCLWLVPATLLSTLILDSLRGRLDHTGWAILRSIQALAYLAGAVIAWRLGAGLMGFALAFVASHAVALLASGVRLASRAVSHSPPIARRCVRWLGSGSAFMRDSSSRCWAAGSTRSPSRCCSIPPSSDSTRRR